MALYDRLMGLAEPRIPVHEFFSVMQEYMLGNMTGGQATTAFGLDAGEQTQALALRDRILTESTPALRWQKALEFENVLIVAAAKIVPYTTVAAVKTRLGVT